MDLLQLAQKVQEMRDAQKAYFMFRKSSDLMNSKKLEQQVDTAIKDLLSRDLSQPKLF